MNHNEIREVLRTMISCLREDPGQFAPREINVGSIVGFQGGGGDMSITAIGSGRGGSVIGGNFETTVAIGSGFDAPNSPLDEALSILEDIAAELAETQTATEGLSQKIQRAGELAIPTVIAEVVRALFRLGGIAT